MNLKASKGGFNKENINPNDEVHNSCVIGCHGNSLLHFDLNKKSVVIDFKEGVGVKYFATSISQCLWRVRR